MHGKISRIYSAKGFGFIKGEDGKDYFFHRSDVQGFFDDMIVDVDSGQIVPVNFDVVKSPKGPRAGNVTRADWPNESTATQANSKA